MKKPFSKNLVTQLLFVIITVGPTSPQSPPLQLSAQYRYQATYNLIESMMKIIFFIEVPVLYVC